MELSKKSLDDLISVADKIIEANRSTEKDLFGEIKNPEKIKKILGIEEQDPEQSYKLYYGTTAGRITMR